MPVEDHVLHLANGRLQANGVQSVQKIVDRAVAHDGKGIVVHFHGGLVSYDKGMTIARRLHQSYLDAGAFPVFFVWESGLVETIRNNVGEIRKERFFRLVWKRLAKVLMRKLAQNDDQRAAGELPPADDRDVQEAIDKAVERNDATALPRTEPEVPADVTELTAIERLALEEDLRLDAEVTAAIEEISNGLRTPEEIERDRASRSAAVRGSTATLMDPRKLDELVSRPDPASRGFISTARMIKAIVAIAAKVVSRFVHGRDHGFHATLVEEILRELYLANVGQLIWEQIKKDTADAFRTGGSVYGGTAFLEALGDRIDPSDPPPITLVGHSTGAVYISEFLDAAVAVLPDGVRFGIVFQAPASTFERTAGTIAQHASRISGFRMFTMEDEHERADVLVPVVYPHSLLYFVSGVVEQEADTPIVGMHRFYDASRFPDADYPHIRTVRDYVLGQDGRVAWSVSGDGAGDGRRTGARRHSAFDDDDEETLESVKYILQNGF